MLKMKPEIEQKEFFTLRDNRVQIFSKDRNFDCTMVTLKEGDKAPAFTGKDQDGNRVSLTDFKGKKLVLYFYPEDDTPTCTIQACNLRDNYGLLQKNGFEVLGVSPDDASKHKKFESKFQLPFRLIADAGHKILFGHRYMGVLRTTFVIDEKGVIRKIFLRPKNKAHAEEILKFQ